jgi:hypothetical protein
MQHQLRSAVYRPILTAMSLARAAGWRPRCRRQGRNGRPTYVPGRHAPFALTRVGQPKDPS